MAWLELNEDDELIVYGVWRHEGRRGYPSFHGAWFDQEAAEDFIDLATDSPNYYIEEIPVRAFAREN